MIELRTQYSGSVVPLAMFTRGRTRDERLQFFPKSKSIRFTIFAKEKGENQSISENFCENFKVNLGCQIHPTMLNSLQRWRCDIWSSWTRYPISKVTPTIAMIWCRHDICQKIYTTAVLEANILRKKRINCDIIQFVTKERKCFEMA